MNKKDFEDELECRYLDEIFENQWKLNKAWNPLSVADTENRKD